MITYYRTVAFDDLNVFSGKSHRLTLRRAFIAPRLSDFLAHVPRTDRYHVLAPDLPGSGFTDAPDRTNFTYSFDHLKDVIERFTEVLRLRPSVIGSTG